MFREHLGNTACSLFPVPCSLKDSPPPKKNFAADAAKFSLRRPCGASRFARLTCSLFPVPCSHKTPLREHVFRVPCSLSPYGKTHPWLRTRNCMKSKSQYTQEHEKSKNCTPPIPYKGCRRGPRLGTYSDWGFWDFLLLINIFHIIRSGAT